MMQGVLKKVIDGWETKLANEPGGVYLKSFLPSVTTRVAKSCDITSCSQALRNFIIDVYGTTDFIIDFY